MSLDRNLNCIDVSIIVVAWNIKNFVYDCLRSIYEVTNGIRFEIIYVDNASKDGSVEMVKNEFPEVIIIENDENKGFSKANNQAIEISQGRYVLLLNSDTIVLENAIANTVIFADAQMDTAVVGCKVLNPDRTLQYSCFMYPSILNLILSATYLYKIFPLSPFFGRESMTWWDFNNVREVESVRGCFLLVRRKAIEQVGMMDERYYFYGEDMDWCYRFKKAGWKVMFTPVGKIIHYGGQNSKLMARKFRWQLEGSKLIFMRLHRSKLLFPLVCSLSALFFILRIPYWLGLFICCDEQRKLAIEKAGCYSRAAFYCLVSWKKLLMNRNAIEGRI
jgi:GT2 family glycosyltransferase